MLNPHRRWLSCWLQQRSLCEGVRLFSGVPQGCGTQPRTTANVAAFRHIQVMPLPSHPAGPTGACIFYSKDWAGTWQTLVSSLCLFSVLASGTKTWADDGKRHHHRFARLRVPWTFLSMPHAWVPRALLLIPSPCPDHLRASCDVFLGSQSREYSQQCCSVNTRFMEKNRGFFFCWKFFMNYFCLGKHDIILMVRKQTSRPAFCYS